MKEILVVIDGPAGAGKTTISKMLSEKLGYRYVDTGALYRTIALYLIENKIDIQDEEKIKKALSDIEIDLEDTGEILLNNEKIAGKIRTPEISMCASKVSALKIIREYLFNKQREVGLRKKAVFEGRDMGTVVFPEADIKFFLTADSEIRAKRRFLEIEKKSDQTYEEVLEDMKKRDKADSEREHAPLKPAKDSIFVDSSKLDTLQVVEKMISIINEKFFF